MDGVAAPDAQAPENGKTARFLLPLSSSGKISPLTLDENIKSHFSTDDSDDDCDSPEPRSPSTDDDAPFDLGMLSVVSQSPIESEGSVRPTRGDDMAADRFLPSSTVEAPSVPTEKASANPPSGMIAALSQAASKVYYYRTLKPVETLDLHITQSKVLRRRLRIRLGAAKLMIMDINSTLLPRSFSTSTRALTVEQKIDKMLALAKALTSFFTALLKQYKHKLALIVKVEQRLPKIHTDLNECLLSTLLNIWMKEIAARAPRPTASEHTILSCFSKLYEQQVSGVFQKFVRKSHKYDPDNLLSFHLDHLHNAIETALETYTHLVSYTIHFKWQMQSLVTRMKQSTALRAEKLEVDRATARLERSFTCGRPLLHIVVPDDWISTPPMRAGIMDTMEWLASLPPPSLPSPLDGPRRAVMTTDPSMELLGYEGPAPRRRLRRVTTG